MEGADGSSQGRDWTGEGMKDRWGTDAKLVRTWKKAASS